MFSAKTGGCLKEGAQGVHQALSVQPIRSSPAAPTRTPKRLDAAGDVKKGVVSFVAGSSGRDRVLCFGWKGSWRSQVLEPSPGAEDSSSNDNGCHEGPANGDTTIGWRKEEDAKASRNGSRATPLFSNDFVSSLRDSLRKGPTYGDGLRQQGSSSNGNGNGYSASAGNLSSWRTAAAEPEAEEEPAHSSAQDAAGGEKESGSLFNSQFKAALQASLNRSPLYGDSGSSSTATQQRSAADPGPASRAARFTTRNSWRVEADDDDGDEMGSSGSQDKPAAAAAADDDGSLFNAQFKSVLQQALSRSPMYGVSIPDSDNELDTYEQETAPAPGERNRKLDNPIFSNEFKSALDGVIERRKAELGAFPALGSDDDEIPVAVAPVRPPPTPQPAQSKEPSPQEEILMTAVGTAHLSLQRLTLIKNEVERLMEMEVKQIERLQFALQKAKGDTAYMAVLQKMMNERKRKGQ